MKTFDITELCRLFSYEKDTGLLIWKNRRMQSSKDGSVAGCKDSDGYVVLTIKNTQMKAHRVIWAIFYGKWPDGVIDHINGVRSDNRIENLRTGTISQNCQNKRNPLPSSKSGLIGAMFDNSTGRFRSRIKVNGRRINLGSFATAEEAHIAYIKAKREMHEFCSI